MAEVGVYQGCSAKIISMASGGVPLHLFDTFTGLPAPAADEHDRMRTGHYAASLDGVRSFMTGRPDVSFYPGLFPDTTGPVEHRRFSFVHLDVDLKSSTRACLEFFYPRLLPGGVLLTHDYSYLDGRARGLCRVLRNPAGAPDGAADVAGDVGKSLASTAATPAEHLPVRKNRPGWATTPAFSLLSVDDRLLTPSGFREFRTTRVSLCTDVLRTDRMPYQDRHPTDGSDFEVLPVTPRSADRPEATSNARTIQIIIVVGLIAAVVVAIFGNF